MPESPEVDALAGFLRAHVVGREITGVDLAEFRALKTRARPLEGLVGATIAGVTRYGKHIGLETSAGVLVISFGRAGWAVWRAADAPEPEAPVIVRIGLGDRELALTDAGGWLSLGVSVVHAATDVDAIAKLGPDPMSDAFTAAALDAVVIGRRKQLKALLQEQESMSGIGNAYSDEILFTAGLSPLAHAAALDDAERGRLYTAIRDVLGEAFAARRDVPIAEQKAAKVAAMRVHGRTGDPCPDGDGEILDIPGTKGGGQYCPGRQTGGVPLPD